MIIERKENREYNQIRPISYSINQFGYADTSILFSQGETVVQIGVSLIQGVPPFLRGKKRGWLTAEYDMLPTATKQRSSRASVTLKRSPRSVEISRFIGRVFRSISNLDFLGENTIHIDCDVLQADGGTRASCVTAAMIALEHAQEQWLCAKTILNPFLKDRISALSIGLIQGVICLDLDEKEDMSADADFNFVLTESGKIVEIFGTAEKAPIDWDLFLEIKKTVFAGFTQISSLFSKEYRERSVRRIFDKA